MNSRERVMSAIKHVVKPTIIFLSLALVISLMFFNLKSSTNTAYAAPAQYVVNGGVESGSGTPSSWVNWTSGGGTFVWDTAIKHAGSKSLKITQTSSSVTSLWYQNITSLTPGRSYIFTGWIKTSSVVNGTNSNAVLGVEFYNSGGGFISSLQTVKFYNTVDWTMVTLRFTVPIGTTTTQLGGYLWATTGTVWFDDFSIIDQNRVENGDMEAGSGSLPSNFTSWSNGGATFSWDSAEYHAGYKSAKIFVGSRSSSTFYQNLNGWEVGKTYTVSGWVKTNSVDNNPDVDASINIEMKDGAGAIISQVNGQQLSGTVDWTRVTFKYTVPVGTETVTLNLLLWDTKGTVWFDDISSVEEFKFVKNGGMESGTGTTADNYTSWTGSPGVPTFTWDNIIFHNPNETSNFGTRSLKISQSSAAYSIWWQFLDGWKVGKKYKVSGWIKTDTVQSGVAGEGVLLGVDISDSTDTWLSSANSTSLFGTNDWKYSTFTFTVPAQAQYVKVILKLWNKTGTAWFDDITVRELPDVEIAEPAVSGKWWDYWPRFTNGYGLNINPILNLEANVSTVSVNAYDEGRGAYFRDSEFTKADGWLKAMDTEGIRKSAWLEQGGEARAILGAVHDLGGGSYEIDPLTGNPKLIAHNWTWDVKGPDVNVNANQIVWMGLHSWANQETWQGSAVRPATFPQPTYPDGTPATGYLDASIFPTKAKLYDAMASKDLNGKYMLEGLMSAFGTSNTGKVPVLQPDGSTKYYGDIFFGKDLATDWWTKYNIQAARYFIDRGISAFWVDNYSGYEFIGTYPMRSSFGYWTESKFRDFLAAHPGIVANPSTFDIKAYLVNQFLAWYPALDPYNLTDPTGWKDSRWQQVNVWKAFMSFKAETAHTRAQELYDGIKTEAVSAGKNPDDILVGGNDIPRLSFAAITGTEVDMVNSEYNPFYSAITGFSVDGLPPYGHAGPTYSLSVNFAKSKRANIWYYLADGYAKYQNRSNLGEILGYEALSKNTLMNTSNETPSIAGNDDASKKINRYIKNMTSTFGQRKSVGKIGLVYSTQSELNILMPGGYLNYGQQYNIGEFDGWGTALEDLNYPYRAIPEYKITSADLADIDVLILPHVKVITSAMVNNVLIPFANSGKTILVSGTNSGSIKPWSDLFANNTSALLYDLTTTGQAQFVSGTPGSDFYAVHLTPGTDRTNKLNVLKNTIENLITSGKLVREINLTNFNEFVLTSLNYDSSSSAKVFFVDLLNENYDLPRDILTAEDGGTLRINLPLDLQGKSLTVKFYDTDQNGTSQTLTYTTVDSKTIDVNIPGFRVYGSLVITAVNLVANPGFEADGATLTPSGWSTSGADTDADYTQLGGHTGSYELVHWKNTAYNVYTYQTKTVLTNGLYTLKAWIMNPYGNLGTAYMEAKDFGGTAIQYNIPVSTPWIQISIPNINVTNGQCTIGFYSNTPATFWYSVDDVEFYKQ